jgi:O-antigen/teichoic acid export membrane protein
MLNRVVRAVLAIAFGQGLNILSNILLVPLYLQAWSLTLYGEWLVIYSVASYLLSLDMGMQMYVVNRLTQSYARREMAQYQASQHTALAFSILVAAIGTITVAIIAISLPLNRWLNLHEINQQSASLIIFFLGCQLLWSLPVGLCLATYRTVGNLSASQWLVNAHRLLTFTVTTIALIMKASMPVLAALQILPFCLITLIAIIDIKRSYPEIAPGVRNAKLSLLRDMFKPSLFFAAITISMAIGLQGSVQLIGMLLGSAVVAHYVTVRTLTSAVRQAVSLFNDAIWLDLTRLDALADRNLANVFNLLVGLNTCGCIAVSASLWFEGADLIAFWTGGRLVPDPLLLRAMLAYFVLQSAWLSVSVILLSTNRHKRLSISYLGANIGGLMLAALLIPRYGVIGLPTAFIISEALCCYHFTISDACKVVGESYYRFTLRLIAVMTIVVVAAGLTTGWLHQQFGTIPLPWRCLLSGSASATVSASIAWFCWLRAAERAFISKKLNLGLLRLKGLRMAN